MGLFDDIILKTSISDEADRAALATLAEKYPALRKTVDDRDEAAAEWERWRKTHWNEELHMTTETAAAVREAEAAKLRVQALEAAGLGGGDMTFEQIEAQLKQAGVVYKSDLAGAAEPLVINRVNQSAAGIEHFYRKTFTIPAEYIKEFGDAPPENLLDQILDKYPAAIKLNPSANPRDIYNQIVEPKRAEIRAAKAVQDKIDYDKAIAEAKEAGRKEAMLASGMAPGASGMPVDQYPTPSLNARTESAARAEKAGDKLAQDILNRPLGSTAADGLAWLQAQRTNGVQ